MPSILKTKARRVLRYFNKYGFNNINLTILIMDVNSNLDEVVKLEQLLIDTLKPNLNVDLVAGGINGYHKPMSQEAKDKLRKIRGTCIYLYDMTSKSLIFISDSKQWLYSNIGIHHISLNNCIIDGKLYLNRFLFSMDIISELPYESILTSEDLVLLINTIISQYKPNQPKSKKVLSENVLNHNLNFTFSSIGELAKHLKGDKSTIRKYILGRSEGLYRKQWKFTLIDT